MLPRPLRWLVSGDDRRTIENDLSELYELRLRHDGEHEARRWLRRQWTVLTWHLLLDRVRALFPGWTIMHHLSRDLRYALRSLARVPVLTITIIVTVGIGLGATTAMITAVRAVLVNPLPYMDAGSLFWIYTGNPPYRFRFSVVDYRALEADHPAFAAVAAYQTNQVTLGYRDLSERVYAKSVTGSYFPLLGQKPHLGRLVEPADDGRADRVTVLTHRYWARRFGADPAVLGRTVTLNGDPHTIIGVLERTDGPLEHDIAAFTAERWPVPTRKGPFLTMAIARLRADVSKAAAQDALHATNRRLFPIWKSSYQDEKATWGMLDLKQRAIGDIGSSLLFVLAAVAFVLLISCANAINLLIARGLHRGRELAIRGALGASRGRLLQHVFVEAAALTTAAAVVGLAVAAIALQLLATHGGDYVPRIDEIRLSAEALGWLAALSAVAGLVIGVVPALHASRLTISRVLGAGGRSATDAPAARRVRRALVAAEFALATPLLVAAALVLASLARLASVPVGVEAGRLLTASIALAGPRYTEDGARSQFWKRSAERLKAIPGVEIAAIADSRPPSEAGQQNNFDLADRPTLPGQNQPICTWVGVSPEFFRAVGVRLERGQLLDDRSAVQNAVVVDRAWVHRFFPGEEAVGRKFRSGGCTTCPYTVVVGVVSNVKWTGLDGAEDGTVYFPITNESNAFVVLRTAGTPAAIAKSLDQAVKELDPTLALSDLATGEQLIGEALATPRYLSVLIGALALTALVLSIVGIYGVMAYFVQQHAREIGIRLALGGDPARVRRMVVGHGLRLVGVGVMVGIGAAFAASQTIRTVLFGVDPTDLRAMIGIPATLVAAAVAACLVPAWRAASVDPANVLRES